MVGYSAPPAVELVELELELALETGAGALLASDIGPDRLNKPQSFMNSPPSKSTDDIPSVALAKRCSRMAGLRSRYPYPRTSTCTSTYRPTHGMALSASVHAAVRGCPLPFASRRPITPAGDRCQRVANEDVMMYM